MSQVYIPRGMRINPAVIRATCVECKGEVPYNDDAALFSLCLRALTRQPSLKGSEKVSGTVVTGDMHETSEYYMKDPWKRSRHIFSYHNCQGTPEVVDLMDNEIWTLPNGKLRPVTPSEREHIERILEYMHKLEEDTIRLDDEKRWLELSR